MKRLILILVASLAGCATRPDTRTAFERCVDTVAGKTVYAPDRLRAAEWCNQREGR